MDDSMMMIIILMMMLRIVFIGDDNVGVANEVLKG